MSSLSSKIEDHALEAVPIGDRQSWWQLAWSTVGVGTTLVALFLGALVTFAAGMKVGILAGIFVSLIVGLMGWGVGHIAYRTGLSSSVLARWYGFGKKGSSIVALSFGIFIIAAICFEDIMIYHALVFWFGIQDTATNQIIIYTILTVTWILLTAYGFRVMARVASLTVIGFLASLIYIAVEVVVQSGQTWAEVVSFGTQFPPETLDAMGLGTEWGKFAFCVNITIGVAGGLAFVDADVGRYGRSSGAVGTAAFLGSFFLNILVLAAGGIVMYAGIGQVVDYHVAQGMTQAQATTQVLESPEAIAVAFIIFGGALGGVLIIMAQSKIQVINTYSSSLSLANLFDVTIDWRPGRLAFVIGANLIACALIYINLLHVFREFITILGVLITCYASIIIIDYFIISKFRDNQALQVDWNWPAIVTVFCGFVLARYVLRPWIPIEFITSFASTVVLYPLFALLAQGKKQRVRSV